MSSWDLECASCGRPMASVKASLPAGLATCQPCRRKGKGPGLQPKPWMTAAARCPTCGADFNRRQHNQIYCSPDCRPSNRWRDHVASADERGYGREHRALRRQWAKVVAKGETHCWRCGVWLNPAEPWHLGHDDDDRSQYRGPECVPCNLVAGAIKGNKGRAPQLGRKMYDHECATCGRPFVSPWGRQRYCSRECKPARKEPAPKLSRIYSVTCWCGAVFTTRSTQAKSDPPHECGRRPEQVPSRPASLSTRRCTRARPGGRVIS